jgi:chromatin structure-remodeling complex subunit SFH1
MTWLSTSSRSQEELETQADKSSSLIPIRVEFETDTHRIRDCFVWNLHEALIKPDTFARIFCTDLELPLDPWAETVANQIRAQIEDHENVASVDLSTGVDDSFPPGMDENSVPEEMAVVAETNPECRVLLSVLAFSRPVLIRLTYTAFLPLL